MFGIGDRRGVAAQIEKKRGDRIVLPHPDGRQNRCKVPYPKISPVNYHTVVWFGKGLLSVKAAERRNTCQQQTRNEGKERSEGRDSTDSHVVGSSVEHVGAPTAQASI